MTKRTKKRLINLIPIRRVRHKMRARLDAITQHPLAASDAASMYPVAEMIKRQTNLNVENIFEIGANYGQDAAGLAKYFNVAPQNVYAFEARPDFCPYIRDTYGFNVFNNAVFNHDTTLDFNMVKMPGNSGISSVYDKERAWHATTQKIQIPAIRMDTFMREHKISHIDFLKLDVEGANWEVLDGFGRRLKDVNAIHIEAEHTPIWRGQKLWPDIYEKLKSAGFEMLYFERKFVQSDSVWVQKRFLINKIPE